MASIHKRLAVHVPVDKAWASLRHVANAHQLFAPVLTGASLDGGMRTVTFANGLVVRERIVDIDDENRRVVYSATDVPGMTYHHASMQMLEARDGGSEFVWITDFLPAGMADTIGPLIDQGAQALKKNLEAR
ncbi:MAG TPA: SRPBCC family protein [Vicinamibacterales bacterium]|nr:SRPBCC family protein [Vicinamibacterales bacterium]